MDHYQTEEVETASFSNIGICLSFGGLRSFTDGSQTFNLTHPITVILGDSASGKTTIIEGLKYLLLGTQKPNKDKANKGIKIQSLASPLGTLNSNKVEVEIQGPQAENFMILTREIYPQRTSKGNIIVRCGKLQRNISREPPPVWEYGLLNYIGQKDAQKLCETNCCKISYIYLCPGGSDKWPCMKVDTIQNKLTTIFGLQGLRLEIGKARKEKKGDLTTKMRSLQKTKVEALNRCIKRLQTKEIVGKGGLGQIEIGLECKGESSGYKYKVIMLRENKTICMHDQCCPTEQALGSVIIRLALAEMLSSEGFPILCLDDPTQGICTSEHVTIMLAVIEKFHKGREGNILELPRLLVTTSQKDFGEKLCEKAGNMLKIKQSNFRVSKIGRYSEAS